ncbi:KH domain-containing protein [Amycolatopsis rifamycinica]|uniref:K Homology domain-containing protein n=1 Tax=Amycolatopsis rifamycinica TaxID=287986 RepID=A0A066UCA3_9PSEU|nr:KH domain-containing protein [Amycolatopsis rifamycinica]KDN21863.1 hypothetical protein DV20_13110 [Amycolatopsis rifamycinica]
MTVDVEVVLDVRDLRAAPSTPTGFAELWASVEPELVGRDISRKAVHELDGAAGRLRLEIVRLPPGAGLVGPDTRFSIVAVRETARLRYRCTHCRGRGTYGPFLCKTCPSDGENRVCDRHVVILDGSLTATCPDHRPACRCDAPATFRCAGKACRTVTAWCDAHRKRHPRDHDLNYCPSCYDVTFPRCDERPCPDLGSVRCEHVTSGFRRCGRRMCTRHASRWQVFGGERVGLGRCAGHREVRNLGPEDVLFQIVAGAALRKRKDRLPSLQGFAHNLRGVGMNELALDFAWIHRTLAAVVRRTQPDAAVSAEAMKAKSEWDEQFEKIKVTSQTGRHLVEQLRGLVPTALAGTIEYADYRPATRRGGVDRPALLFVKVPEHQRGHFIGPKGAAIKSYRSRLGVDVQIEGDRRR